MEQEDDGTESKEGGLYQIQSDQSTRSKSAGNDYSQNMLKTFISATSVVSNYPKECPLTKIFFKIQRSCFMFFSCQIIKIPATGSTQLEHFWIFCQLGY